MPKMNCSSFPLALACLLLAFCFLSWKIIKLEDRQKQIELHLFGSFKSEVEILENEKDLGQMVGELDESCSKIKQELLALWKTIEILQVQFINIVNSTKEK